MRAGKPTGSGIRLRVYGVRLATVPADGGFQLVTDDQGRLVPTGEQYRIPRALAVWVADGAGSGGSGPSVDSGDSAGADDSAGDADAAGDSADSPDPIHPLE